MGRGAGRFRGLLGAPGTSVCESGEGAWPAGRWLPARAGRVPTVRDPEIRAAFAARLAKAHRGREHLLVDEVEVRGAGRRVDLLMISDGLTAIEVKSDVDTLRRLEGQVDAYGRLADKALLVTEPRHLDAALGTIPAWWGVWVATPRDRSVGLQCVRRPRRNRGIEARSLSALLLRHELLAELRWYDVPRVSSLTVNELRDAVAERVTMPDLQSRVRRVLLSREAWQARARSFERPAGWVPWPWTQTRLPRPAEGASAPREAA